MEGSPSSSGSSTAVSASPGRIQRPGRQGSESMPLLATTPTSLSHAQLRTASRGRWLLVQSCFLFLVLAGVVLFSLDARRTAWITGLVQGTGPQAPAPAFQVGRTFLLLGCSTRGWEHSCLCCTCPGGGAGCPACAQAHCGRHAAGKGCAGSAGVREGGGLVPPLPATAPMQAVSAFVCMQALGNGCWPLSCGYVLNAFACKCCAGRA